MTTTMPAMKRTIDALDKAVMAAQAIDIGEARAVLTDAPLKGLSLAREAGTILAWDERGQLYLLDLLRGGPGVGRGPQADDAGGQRIGVPVAEAHEALLDRSAQVKVRDR